MNFNGIFHYKPSILGVPPFIETPSNIYVDKVSMIISSVFWDEYPSNERCLLRCIYTHTYIYRYILSTISTYINVYIYIYISTYINIYHKIYSFLKLIWLRDLYIYIYIKPYQSTVFFLRFAAARKMWPPRRAALCLKGPTGPATAPVTCPVWSLRLDTNWIYR